MPAVAAPRILRARLLPWGVLLAAALLVGSPVAASAHAELVSSTPPAGAQLGLAPAVVTLDFSEALNPGLSSATVTDGAGATVSAHAVGQREIRVSLSTDIPGRYLVRWTAVSVDDGHTTQGSFTFTVAARGVAGAAGGSGAGPSASDAAIAVGRAVEDIALLLAVGMLALGWLARGAGADWVRLRLLPVVLVALVGGCAVVASEAGVAGGGTLGGALSYLGSGVSGPARLARLVAEACALAAVSAGLRAWGAGAVITAVLALAASGHASGNAPGAAGVLLDAAHLLTAGVWAGGILAMATLRPPQGWRSGGPLLLRAWSPWALSAFSATVGLGMVQAVLDVGGLAPLTGTPYGRTLLVKAGAVMLMLPLSLVAWRRRRPRPRVEATLGVAVIAAAAVLASSPVPARSTPAAAAAAPAATPVLPSGQVLTLADRAGSTLVGVTVDPGRPGRNRLIIDAMPSGARAAARHTVRAELGGAPVGLTACGDTCSAGEVTVRGGDTIRVSVDGAGGGSATFVLPALPAPDGTGVLQQARARMRALHTFAMHETLTSGGPLVVTDYQAVAPDRLQYTQPTGFSSIIIGTTRYSRQHPGAPWTVESGGPTIQEPDFVWDAFSPIVGVHITGHPVVDGTPTTEVAFFAGNASTPVWFRLDVDQGGLVRRAEMRAPGHFMEQTFSDYDAPLSVTAPPGARP